MTQEFLYKLNFEDGWLDDDEDDDIDEDDDEDEE